MTGKLTLSIDASTILRAKRISRKKGKSISSMVSAFLEGLNDKEEIKESFVMKMSGALKDQIPADIDWKNIKQQYQKTKHGN